ncbi:MAG: PIG-L deacetylase family protein [Promethearchaeota archaeon]
MSDIKYDPNFWPLGCSWIYPRESRAKKIYKILVICAHPDDPVLLTGGLTYKLTQHGHKVKWLSVTNGNIGHQTIGPIELAAIELEEARAAAESLGAEYETLNVNDGWVFVNRENTEKIVRAIRRYDPDLVITHRPYDYHRDHRYTSQLVMDASYMLIVPHYCPEVPISPSRKHPIICYSYDHFKKPILFEANVLLNITDVYEKKADAIAKHKSQLFEWLPWTQSMEDAIPAEYDEKTRLELVEMLVIWHYSSLISDYRKLWKKGYPNTKVLKGEAFEICEYGRQPSKEDLKLLFPGAYIPSKRELNEVLKK